MRIFTWNWRTCHKQMGFCRPSLLTWWAQLGLALSGMWILLTIVQRFRLNQVVLWSICSERLIGPTATCPEPWVGVCEIESRKNSWTRNMSMNIEKECNSRLSLGSTENGSTDSRRLQLGSVVFMDESRIPIPGQPEWRVYQILTPLSA